MQWNNFLSYSGFTISLSAYKILFCSPVLPKAHQQLHKQTLVLYNEPLPLLSPSCGNKSCCLVIIFKINDEGTNCFRMATVMPFNTHAGCFKDEELIPIGIGYICIVISLDLALLGSGISPLLQQPYPLDTFNQV